MDRRLREKAWPRDAGRRGRGARGTLLKRQDEGFEGDREAGALRWRDGDTEGRRGAVSARLAVEHLRIRGRSGRGGSGQGVRVAPNSRRNRRAPLTYRVHDTTPVPPPRSRPYAFRERCFTLRGGWHAQDPAFRRPQARRAGSKLKRR